MVFVMGAFAEIMVEMSGDLQRGQLGRSIRTPRAVRTPYEHRTTNGPTYGCGAVRQPYDTVSSPYDTVSSPYDTVKHRKTPYVARATPYVARHACILVLMK